MTFTRQHLVRRDRESPEWIHKFNRRVIGETPHTDDKFFADGEPLGTQVTPAGTVTWTKQDDRLYVNAINQAANDAAAMLYALTPSSSPVTMDTAIQRLGNSASFPGMGILLTDGTTTTSNGVIVFVYQDVECDVWSGTITAMTTSLGNTAIGQGNRTMSGHHYLRLIWDSSNTFRAGFSKDGENWNYNADDSVTLTPTHYGVFGTAWGGGTVAGSGAFEYLRVADSDLSA